MPQTAGGDLGLEKKSYDTQFGEKRLKMTESQQTTVPGGFEGSGWGHHGGGQQTGKGD